MAVVGWSLSPGRPSLHGTASHFPSGLKPTFRVQCFPSAGINTVCVTRLGGRVQSKTLPASSALTTTFADPLTSALATGAVCPDSTIGGVPRLMDSSFQSQSSVLVIPQAISQSPLPLNIRFRTVFNPLPKRRWESIGLAAVRSQATTLEEYRTPTRNRPSGLSVVSRSPSSDPNVMHCGCCSLTTFRKQRESLFPVASQRSPRPNHTKPRSPPNRTSRS
jgi:hypothetical protein